MLLHHAVRVSVGKTKGRRLLGRPGRRRVDAFRMDDKETGCGGRGLDKS